MYFIVLLLFCLFMYSTLLQLWLLLKCFTNKVELSSTADAHEYVDKVEILHGLAATHHMPVSIMLNVENLSALCLCLLGCF